MSNIKKEIDEFKKIKIINNRKTIMTHYQMKIQTQE